MMKPEYCPDYVGVACVDGTCPVANCEEYAERCMPVISSCRNCFYYKGCEDCAISDDCDRMEDKVVIYATPTITGAVPYNTHDLVIDLGNSVPHPDRFNCPYVNRIGQLTVSVLLNRFARKEHRA